MQSPHPEKDGYTTQARVQREDREREMMRDPVSKERVERSNEKIAEAMAEILEREAGGESENKR